MEIMKTAPFKLHSPLFDFPTAMEKQGFPGLERSHEN